MKECLQRYVGAIVGRALILAAVLLTAGCSGGGDEDIEEFIDDTLFRGMYQASDGMVIELNGVNAADATVLALGSSTYGDFGMVVGDRYFLGMIENGPGLYRGYLPKPTYVTSNGQRTMSGYLYETGPITVTDSNLYIENTLAAHQAWARTYTRPVVRNPNPSGSCPIGNWKTPSCGGAKQQQLLLNSDGSGSFTNPDCNNICDPLKFPFNYTVSGSSVTLRYTTPPSVACEGYGQQQPPRPKDDTFQFSCSGNQMTTTTSLGTIIYTK